MYDGVQRYGIIPDVPIEAKLVPAPHFLIFDLS